MKTLVVEDDFTNRLYLQEILNIYGTIHIAVDGQEAVEAVRTSLESGMHYDLICMDIMMPVMDGMQALREIRALEESHGIPSTKGAKIIMTTAVDDMHKKIAAFGDLCDDYLAKPIRKERLLTALRNLKLIP